MMKKKLNIPFDQIERKVAALPLAYKAVIPLAIIILVGGPFYFFFYKGNTDKIKSLRSKVSQQEKRLEQLRKAAQEVKKLRRDLVEAEKKLDELLTLLPDKKEIPGLLENVTRLGAQEGLENVLFQPQSEQKQEFHATIPVRLDLIGTYHKLGKFFDKVSRLDRILKVDRLTLQRTGGDSANIKVNCTVYTYRFLKDEALKEDEEKGGKKKKRR